MSVNADRDRRIVEAVRAGATLREAGERFGISYERVRQIVKRIDPAAIIEGQRVRLQAALDGRRAEKRTPSGKPLLHRVCKVCGAPYTTTNPRSVTDTPECARKWTAGGYRYHDPENRARQHLVQARANLRNPNAKPAHVRWALKVLERAGEEPPAEYLARLTENE